jgi:hypothetical protein
MIDKFMAVSVWEIWRGWEDTIKVNLKEIVCVREWTVFIWLRIGISGGFS